jgi:hypothetical protein
MSTPADQLDATLQPAPLPVSPGPAAPPSTAVAPPTNLADAYMAHNDTMRGSAAVESLDATMKGQPKDTAAPPKPAESASSTTVGQKAEAVGKDIGLGVIELPRAIVKGVRDAYQSMIDLTKEAVDFAGEHLPAPPADVTAKSEARKAAVGNEPTNVGELPDIAAPKSVTGNIEKNVVQFVTSLRAAGSQLKALGVPEAASVVGSRAVTALKGFVGMFEGFDGSQQDLSNLVQSSPALANPVSAFLATKPDDSDAVNRLKSAVEGTVGGQLVDAFVGGLRFLRSANSAKAAAEDAAGLAEGNADLGEDIGPPSKAMTELGDVAAKDDAPLVSARFNNAQTKIADQEFTAEGISPEQVRAMGKAAEPLTKGQNIRDRLGVGDQLTANGPKVLAVTDDVIHFSDGTTQPVPEELRQKPWTDADQLGTSRQGAANEGSGSSALDAEKAQPKEPGVYVNFAKIDGPDDIKRAMGEMANAFKGSVDSARRGVQTFEDTKLGADAVNAWDTLMSRRVGEPLNAEESLAARQLWASSASKTYDLAGIATNNPTPENLFAFRKMLATHAAIQEQVIAARTETARALSSWRIPAGAQDQRLAQMMSALKRDTGPASDGLSVSLNLAQRVKALQTAGDVDGLNHFSEKGVYATTRDAALEAWTNGLLTSPATHVKVFVSNAATTALRIGERSIAGQMDALVGKTDGVAVGEASAQYSGLVSSLKDAFRYAGKSANAFLNEEPLPPLGDDPLSNAIKAAKTGTYSMSEAGEAGADHNFGGAISSQAFNISQSGWVGQAVDYLGGLVRSPGRALTAEHDFFRSIGYRMELNALATRQATGEVQAGKITEDALGGRIAEIMANPPPSVTIGSVNAMTYQSFTDAPGKLANLIEQARTDFPLLRVILPFYKIPSRILSFTFERSPLAPLMSAYQANIAAGGARESLARAQMGLGTAMMLATADAVLSGQVTGSGPPEKSQRGAMQDTGWLPYSMKVGDRWVQYNKLETIGSSMAMAADVVETLHGYNAAVNGDDPDMLKLGIATTLAIAQDITSKTYLEGLSRFFETLTNPKTEGEHQAQSLAGSLVPAGVAAADRLQDPYQRQVYSIIDAMKARTPGLSESLPPRRDVWGEPIAHDSGMGKAYDLLSPFPTRQPIDSPIDKEIVRLGANVNLPAARVSFGQGASVDLRKDPAIYSRYVELAGNAYKDPAWGLGAKDLLNQIVSGTHPLSQIYQMKSDGPDGMKAEMIKGIMNQYREGAKQQLLSEYPQLQGTVDKKRESIQALKMPVIG